MRREDGTGEGGRVEGDAGASFGGSIAQSKKRKGIWHSGSARSVFGTRQRNAQRELQVMRGMRGRERENWLL